MVKQNFQPQKIIIKKETNSPFFKQINIIITYYEKRTYEKKLQSKNINFHLEKLEMFKPQSDLIAYPAISLVFENNLTIQEK